VCHNGAKSLDVVTFASEIRDRVRDRFGVTLVAEPTLWGFREPLL
jgi:UDP-N-acetylenolpyruvoylglucosamine reductase